MMSSVLGRSIALRRACTSTALRFASQRTRTARPPVERRFGPDGGLCTFDQFLKRGGSSSTWKSLEEERRLNTDGVLYSLAEFLEFYGGDSDGVAYQHWDAAKHAAHKLTKTIKETTSIPALLELHAKENQALDHVHVPTIWHHMCILSGRDRNRSWLRRNERELRPLHETTLAMMPELRGRGLGNIAYSLARCQLAGRQPWSALFDELAHASVRRLGEFNPQHLANTAWAYATAGHASPALFDELAHASVRRLGEFQPQDLANTAWAYATAGHASPALFDAMAHASVRRLGEFKPQELANTAWAYTTLDMHSDALFRGPSFAQACMAVDVTAWEVQHLTQLHKWQQWRDRCHAASHCDWPSLPSRLRRSCAASCGSDD
jgi:hypothetical protein